MRLANVTKTMGRAVMCLALLAPAAGLAEEAAAPAAEQSWKAEGRVWLEGDSTLHKYSAEARNLSTKLKVAAGADEVNEAAIRGGMVKAMELVVPVARLTSGDSSLDKNLRKTMKAPEHPNIVFKLKKYEVKGEQGGVLDLRLDGTLAMAGVQKPVQIDVKAKPAGAGMQLTGEKALKMTDFGIEPPVMMLGALKTSNDVTVKFDLQLVAEPAKRAGM